jgi:hypothetical protein
MESAGDARAARAFFTLERPSLDGAQGGTPSVFGDVFRTTQWAGNELTNALVPTWPAAEPAALAPRWFDAGQQVTVPPGLCRTTLCKTLVWIGAGAVGVGVGVIATGGEGNRTLGTAVALAGAGLIVVALLVD